MVTPIPEYMPEQQQQQQPMPFPHVHAFDKSTTCTLCQKNTPITQILIPLVEKRMSVSGVCTKCLEKHSATQPSFYQRQLGLSELGIGGGRNRCIPFEPVGHGGQRMAASGGSSSAFEILTKTLWLIFLACLFVFVCYSCFKVIQLQTQKYGGQKRSSGAQQFRLPTVDAVKGST